MDSQSQVITVSIGFSQPPQDFRQFCDKLIESYFQGAVHSKTNNFGSSTTELYAFDGSNIEISFNAKKNTIHVRTREDLLERIRTDQKPRVGFLLNEKTEVCEFHLHAFYNQFTGPQKTKQNPRAEPKEKKMLQPGSQIYVPLGSIPTQDEVVAFVMSVSPSFLERAPGIHNFGNRMEYYFDSSTVGAYLLIVTNTVSSEISISNRTSDLLPISQKSTREFFTKQPRDISDAIFAAETRGGELASQMQEMLRTNAGITVELGRFPSQEELHAFAKSADSGFTPMVIMGNTGALRISYTIPGYQEPLLSLRTTDAENGKVTLTVVNTCSWDLSITKESVGAFFNKQTPTKEKAEQKQKMLLAGGQIFVLLETERINQADVVAFVRSVDPELAKGEPQVRNLGNIIEYAFSYPGMQESPLYVGVSAVDARIDLTNETRENLPITKESVGVFFRERASTREEGNDIEQSELTEITLVLPEVDSILSNVYFFVDDEILGESYPFMDYEQSGDAVDTPEYSEWIFEPLLSDEGYGNVTVRFDKKTRTLTFRGNNADFDEGNLTEESVQKRLADYLAHQRSDRELGNTFEDEQSETMEVTLKLRDGEEAVLEGEHNFVTHVIETLFPGYSTEPTGSGTSDDDDIADIYGEKGSESDVRDISVKYNKKKRTLTFTGPKRVFQDAWFNESALISRLSDYVPQRGDLKSARDPSSARSTLDPYESEVRITLQNIPRHMRFPVVNSIMQRFFSGSASNKVEVGQETSWFFEYQGKIITATLNDVGVLSFKGPSSLFEHAKFTDQTLSTAMVESIYFTQAPQPGGQPAQATLAHGQRLQLGLINSPTDSELIAFAASISPGLKTNSNPVGRFREFTFYDPGHPGQQLYLSIGEMGGQTILTIRNGMERPIQVTEQSVREFFEARFREREKAPAPEPPKPKTKSIEIMLSRPPTSDDAIFINSAFFRGYAFTREGNKVTFQGVGLEGEYTFEIDPKRKMITLTASPYFFDMHPNVTPEYIQKRLRDASELKLQVGRTLDIIKVEQFAKREFSDLVKVGVETVTDERKGPVTILKYNREGSNVPYILRMLLYTNTGELVIIGSPKYIQPLKKDPVTLARNIAIGAGYASTTHVGPKQEDRKEGWQLQLEKCHYIQVQLPELVCREDLKAFILVFLKEFGLAATKTDPVGPRFSDNPLGGERAYYYLEHEGKKVMIYSDLPSLTQKRKNDLPENARTIVVHCNVQGFLNLIQQRVPSFLSQLPDLRERIKRNDPTLEPKARAKGPREVPSDIRRTRT